MLEHPVLHKEHWGIPTSPTLLEQYKKEGQALMRKRNRDKIVRDEKTKEINLAFLEED